MSFVTTDESTLEAVARRVLPASATDQLVTQMVSALKAANPSLNPDNIPSGTSIVVPAAPSTTTDPGVASALLAGLETQIASAVTALKPAANSNSAAFGQVANEWIGQLSKLITDA
jgi:hypothetical protein